MSEKIYVISCSQDLVKMGLDRIRSRVEGLEETELSLDWTSTKLVPVVAKEKMSYQEGQFNIVDIHPIDVPAYSMVFQSFYGANGMGHLACIGSMEFKSFNEDRTADKAMFQSRIKAAVLPGDLLGQVMVVSGKPK
ncbi:MAG: DUF22 domain-containing protein [Candidatus Thorarchaeota archaeon]